ncbi:MAG: hypothetical protein WCX65_15895, partial [bacterium]
DGWVAVSNTEKGFLISADARVNTTPAYCPMRLREREKIQSVTMNPFGTYFGKQFSQLSEGQGFAGEFVRIVGTQFRPTAPSFNGRRVQFRMMLAPYAGDGPAETLRGEADLFSLPPTVVIPSEGSFSVINDFPYDEDFAASAKENNLDACVGWNYDDFLTDRNKDIKPGVPEDEQGTPITAFIKIIIDGIKMRP